MPNEQEFKLLDGVQQMMLLMDKGYPLLARKEGQLSIKLFEFNGFYVEVKYHSQLNKIESIEQVELSQVTDAYLDNIKIENLF
ncbi:MAG: hypothetical protein JW729_00450 [Bacteroidales bacterium]|nr:hypothetical protein [Bacteroidales bacterium]